MNTSTQSLNASQLYRSRKFSAPTQVGAISTFQTPKTKKIGHARYSDGQLFTSQRKFSAHLNKIFASTEDLISPLTKKEARKINNQLVDKQCKIKRGRDPSPIEEPIVLFPKGKAPLVVPRKINTVIENYSIRKRTVLPPVMPAGKLKLKENEFLDKNEKIKMAKGKKLKGLSMFVIKEDEAKAQRDLTSPLFQMLNTLDQINLDPEHKKMRLRIKY